MPEARFPEAEARRQCTHAALRLEEMKQLVGKLNASHKQVTEMMILFVKDGLGAMAYGQFGGSFPNPTQNAVIASDESRHVFARDNQAEADLATYEAAVEALYQNALVADSLRRKYLSANLDMWNRLDPTDFCRLHWFLMHREEGLQKVIPRRVVGDLCKDCNEFRKANGRPPEPLEVEHFSKNLKWPHKLFDPKERRAV